MGTAEALHYPIDNILDKAFPTNVQEKANVVGNDLTDVVEMEAFGITPPDDAWIDLLFQDNQVCGRDMLYIDTVIDAHSIKKLESKNSLLSEVMIKIASDISLALAATSLIAFIMLFVNSAYMYMVPAGFAMFGFLLFGLTAKKVIHNHFIVHRISSSAIKEGKLGSVT
ncbi:MAG: hypothetical protein AB2827_14440 [Candidatus Thiodiazotropha sp.]